MNEQEIFVKVLAHAEPADRLACLEEACRGNLPLKQRVEVLLQAHERAGQFLESPAAGLDETISCQPLSERPGTVIGRYKLLEQIGEGGMGAVWVAEQSEPVRRRVALKLIKPGMDTRQVLSRFDAERQALALMDHPNIAKVFDGGMTDEGRPYFVMEYVKGLPITQYCDDKRLTVAQRLALFTHVCQAVQHAHQKGIIHRDLKPSNILVCLYDGQPVPKVIDFGLAKAMHQSLTEHTLYTAHGLMVGTPLYMSPEQAEFNNLDIDTRSDIYSLGVILYELLTGTTPLERKQFKDAAWQEMLRLIKEVEPPKPSSRLSGSGSLPSLAAQRQLDPAKLTKTVRGELDWIVMKALEKERSRRYETANGLARDIERHLNNEPVEACPPSATYRLRKLARRHRGILATAGSFAALLLIGISISTLLLIRARDSEAKLRQSLDENQVLLKQKGDALKQKDEALEKSKSALADAVSARQAAETSKELALAATQAAELVVANDQKLKAAYEKITQSEGTAKQVARQELDQLMKDGAKLKQDQDAKAELAQKAQQEAQSAKEAAEVSLARANVDAAARQRDPRHRPAHGRRRLVLRQSLARDGTGKPVRRVSNPSTSCTYSANAAKAPARSSNSGTFLFNRVSSNVSRTLGLGQATRRHQLEWWGDNLQYGLYVSYVLESHEPVVASRTTLQLTAAI